MANRGGDKVVVTMIFHHRNEYGLAVASNFPPPAAGIPQPFPGAARKVANEDRPASINFALRSNRERRDRDFQEFTVPKQILVKVIFPAPV